MPVAVAFMAVFCGMAPAGTRALDNGVVRLPLLGWNSWCSFGPCGTDVCTESQVLATIDGMVAQGVRAAGYDYVTLDDCMGMRRDAVSGELFPDKRLFPRGMAPVAAYAHAHGFKFGVYTSAGNFTCHAKKNNCSGACNVGSLGHYARDAATFAA